MHPRIHDPVRHVRTTYTLFFQQHFFLFRPAYATHSLLACYVFLPITKNSHALVLGLTASMCYLATLSVITYNNTSDYITKVNPTPTIRDVIALMQNHSAIARVNQQLRMECFSFFCSFPNRRSSAMRYTSCA